MPVFLLPLLPIIRAALAHILTSPETKKTVIAELRELAKKSDTKIDDGAVDVFDEAWDVIVPAITKKAS